MLNQILGRASDALASLKQHRYKYSAVGLAFVLALLYSYKAIRHAVHVQDLISKSVLHLAPRNVYRLPNGDGEHGAVDLPSDGGDDSDTVSERQPYVPPEATVVITPKNPEQKLSNIVNVTVIGNYGFTMEPGLDISLVTPGIGIDLKWFYFKKIGTEVGIERYFGPYNQFSPTVGLSYRLDRFRLLKNTELKFNYAPLLLFPISAGIRVGF